jgi:hypothetical protein
MLEQMQKQCVFSSKIGQFQPHAFGRGQVKLSHQFCFVLKLNMEETMFKRLTVNCKKCNTPFVTSENRLADGRGIFCSKTCSISFNARKHGHSTNGQSPTYTTWATMLQRCKNPKNAKFYMYGAVGIDVCDEWLSFDAFLADMGERPKGKTLDRIRGNEGYSKSNCRWATAFEQQANLKNNVIVEYDNEKFTLAQLSRKLGVSFSTLQYRISVGWPSEKWSIPTKKKTFLSLPSSDKTR